MGDCSGCKYEEQHETVAPCDVCECQVNAKPTKYEPMEKQDCSNCKYEDCSPNQEPCKYCEEISNSVCSEWRAKEKEFDTVNHPRHYTNGKYECIDVMLDLFGIDAVKDFCICNALKYLWRHKQKNGIEDIQKSLYYLNKYIELSEHQK